MRDARFWSARVRLLRHNVQVDPLKNVLLSQKQDKKQMMLILFKGPDKFSLSKQAEETQTRLELSSILATQLLPRSYTILMLQDKTARFPNTTELACMSVRQNAR